MLSSRPLEVSCYQIRGILKNRQHMNQKGTQNAPYFVSEAVSPYSYKYESKNIATTLEEDEDKIKPGEGDFKHLCKCKTKQAKDTNKSKKVEKYNLNEDKTLKQTYNDDSNVNVKSKFALFKKKRGKYSVNPLKKSLVSLYRKRKGTDESKDVNDIITENSKDKKNKQKSKREVIDVNVNTTEKRINVKAKHKTKNKGKTQTPLRIADDKTLAENVCHEGICRVNAGKAKNHRCLCDRNKDNVKSGKENEKSKYSKSNKRPVETNVFNDSIAYESANKNVFFNECLCKAYPGSNKKKKGNQCLCKAYAGSNKKKLRNECICKAYTEPPKNNVFTDRLRKVYADLIENNIRNECHCKAYGDSTKNKMKNECLCKGYSGSNKNNVFGERFRKIYRETSGNNNLNECLCQEYQRSNKKNVFSHRLGKAFNMMTTEKNILNNDCLCKEYAMSPRSNVIKDRFRRAEMKKMPTEKSVFKDVCLCKKEKKIKQHAILGAGDQLLKLECTKKCRNVLSGIFNRNKAPEAFVETKPQPPLFAIRVDSSNLDVLNSDEIKGRVNTLGKVKKIESCVCPSRLEKAKYYGIGDTCEAGICESAGNDKYNRFNCKCAKKTIIKCSDSTCDDRTVHINPYKRKNVTMKDYTIQPRTNNPLFKMVLDSNQMNILNTGEIENVLGQATHADICNTGICSDHARNKGTILECKCISKKLAPTSNECDERTCRPKQSKFYILCSRIRTASDRWLWPDSRGRRSYHPNRRQALVLGASAPTGHRKPVNRNNLPISGGRMGRNLPSDIPNDIDCMCYCECNEELKARKSKKHTKKVKRSFIFRRKEMAKNFKKKQKQFSKEQRRKAREELRKERLEQRLEEKKKMEIHKLAMKEAGDGNFLTNVLNGLMNVTLQTISGVLTAVISIIFSPVHSYLYTKNRLKDPIGTAKTFKRWFVNTWKSKESKFSKTLTDSDTLNVLADHLEDSVIFQTLSNKGQTQTERKIYERKAKLRQRRMRKRKDKALYGCRHMLLTTLRQHPCLWVYHICPNFYPQCLSILTMCGNFAHIILFLAALLCWTPCIMMMELVRGCFCCMFCTQ